MAQKVIRCGHSLAVTIPNKFVRTLGVKPGDTVRVEKRPEKSALTIHFRGAQQLAIAENIFRASRKIS